MLRFKPVGHWIANLVTYYLIIFTIFYILNYKARKIIKLVYLRTLLFIKISVFLKDLVCHLHLALSLIITNVIISTEHKPVLRVMEFWDATAFIETVHLFHKKVVPHD